MTQSFVPHKWFKNPHLQTCIPTLVMRMKQLLPFVMEQVPLPDGDMLEFGRLGNSAAPAILLMPGLEGDVTSPYIQIVAKALHDHGWQVLLMHYRSIGNTINKQSKSYNAHCYEDLNALLLYLKDKHQLEPTQAIGFSMGGNILLHHAWQSPHQPFDALTIVSTPFDMYETVEHLPKFYEQRFLTKFKQKSLKRMLEGITLPATESEIKGLKSLKEFDHLITAPLWSHASAEEYYRYASVNRFLHDIKVPTYIIYAKDDPFIPPSSHPTDLESEFITIEAVDTGGHVGFVQAKKEGGSYFWLADKIPLVVDQFSQEIANM